MVVERNREPWERRGAVWKSDSSVSHRLPWEAMREHGRPWEKELWLKERDVLIRTSVMRKGRRG